MKPIDGSSASLTVDETVAQDEIAHDSATQPRSLFGEILDWMLAPLLLIWPISIAGTYLVAASIANVPFDRALEDSATILAGQVHAVGDRAVLRLPISSRDLLRIDDTDRVYFQVVGPKGELLGGDAQLPAPHDEEEPAPGIVQFRNETLGGQKLRIAYLIVDSPLPDGARPVIVQVAETLDKRSQLANEIIKGVILPQFVILPVAVVLVWFGLTRGIRPLSRLQERIQARAPDDMRPIDPREAPEEVGPLVDSFNQLLIRLERNIQDQKRFIADAAHQMRTPLAGLRTQAELALREQDETERRRSLQQLATSSIQATRLINQLLALAKAENRAGAGATNALIDLDELARDVLKDWVPAAMENRIDMGYEGLAKAALVRGDQVLLRELLKNLLDNAIRYTPSGGTVTVRVGIDITTGLALLEVEDNGPGIPESERQLVFERFYRILGNGSDGSGLGLAIVREIASRHEAQLVLDASPRARDPRRPGTLISVRFALATDAQAQNA